MSDTSVLGPDPSAIAGGPPPNIAAIAGPLWLGYLLNWALYGVLSSQVYLYYVAFPSDPTIRKALVYGVYLFQTAQVIMLTSVGFNTFAYGFADPSSLNNIGIIWFVVPIMSSIVAFVVQAFYAWRIHILSQSLLYPVMIMVLAVVQLGGGVATGAFGAKAVVFSNFLGRRTFITTALWNGASALADVIIAAAMTYYLSSRKSQWKPTQNLVQRLIRLIIETGTLTAAIAIVNLILSVLPGSPTYYQTTSAILGKLYSNTMMVVLNSRIKIGRLRSESDSEGGGSSGIMTNSDMQFRPGQLTGRVGGNKARSIALKSIGGGGGKRAVSPSAGGYGDDFDGMPHGGVTVTRTQEEWLGDVKPGSVIEVDSHYADHDRDVKYHPGAV